MFLTGSHKVGLMGLVLVPSSTLETELESRKLTNEHRQQTEHTGECKKV
jgi:hypothetical protein